jgi:hypothetical protein|nr:hypothetical protein [Kofleriaceae bacterium]
MTGSRIALAAIAIALAPAAARADTPDAPFPNLPAVVLVKSVTATSTFKDPHDAYAAWKTIAPETRDDPNGMMGARVLWSAWCEGKPDEGIGETVTVTLAEPTVVDAITIDAGVWRTDALFAANNQPTSLEVGFDGKPVTVAPSGKTDTVAKAPGAKGTKYSTITVKIAAVKKGRMNDSCVANIDLMRDGAVLPVALGVDAAAWKALPAAITAIEKAIEDPKRAGLEQLLEFPFSSADPLGFNAGFGDTKTGTVKTWGEFVAACKKYDAAHAKSDTGYADPLGCTFPVNFDPSDARLDLVVPIAPGQLGIIFPGHNDLVVEWLLHWTGTAWRLRTIQPFG